MAVPPNGSGMVSGRSRREHIIGVVVSETSNETMIVSARVTPNSRNSRPIIPPIIKMGIKTATSEILMERTVDPISSAPLKAAAIAFIPCSR